jgi:hypothetical protein
MSCFEPATTAASMAIGEPEAIGDAPARGPELERRMAATGFFASRCKAEPWFGGGKKPGDAVAAQAIEARPSSGQIKPGRGPMVRAPSSILGRRRGQFRATCTRGAACSAKEKKPWRTERTGSRVRKPPGGSAALAQTSISAEEQQGVAMSATEGGGLPAPLADLLSPNANRSTMARWITRLWSRL